MLWLNVTLLQVPGEASEYLRPDWLKILIGLAPLLTFCAALANLILVIYIFRFTRRKNDSDRNLKWFQELIYLPNKDFIFSYFDKLHALKEKLASSPDLSNDDRILLMDVVKNERNTLMITVVGAMKTVAPDTYKTVQKVVDDLTDELTNVFDNDELKWNNPKTIQKELTNRIAVHRNLFIAALFRYKG